MEKNKTFSESDYKISEKEIVKSISKLKAGKSSGLDGVKNEMLKCGQKSLVPCIEQLFNMILSTGQYPKEWKIGYIKPLYKGNHSTVFLIVDYRSFFETNKVIHESK